MFVLGPLLKLSYQLQEYRWADWSLQRWLVIALTVYAGLSALHWIPGGWLGTVAAALVVILVIGFGIWARLRGYIIYHPQEGFSSPTANSPVLLPSDKDRVLVYATGNFSVEGKLRYFVNLQAYFGNLRTREHAVMALVPRSRFLLLGQRPENHIGMWYIFFTPAAIRRLDRGLFWFGASEHSAIRVQYQGEKRIETLYLTVHDPIAFERVLADMRHDAPQTMPAVSRSTERTVPAPSAARAGRAGSGGKS